MFDFLNHPSRGGLHTCTEWLLRVEVRLLSLVDDVCRLEDVIHSDQKLYLVFEFLDLDLKKHMDANPHLCKDHRLVKVPCIAYFLHRLLLYKYTQSPDQGETCSQ